MIRSQAHAAKIETSPTGHGAHQLPQLSSSSGLFRSVGWRCYYSRMGLRYISRNANVTVIAFANARIATLFRVTRALNTLYRTKTSTTVLTSIENTAVGPQVATTGSGLCDAWKMAWPKENCHPKSAIATTTIPRLAERPFITKSARMARDGASSKTFHTTKYSMARPTRTTHHDQ